VFEPSVEELIMLIGDILGPDLFVVIVVLAVLLFGGSAIPKLARNLGSAKNEFEKGLTKALVPETEEKTPSEDS
jgi:sec-independent protein translocase protein TatA